MACHLRATYVSHCRVLALGEFTVMMPEPHVTLQGCSYLAKSMSISCHIAGCKIFIRHNIENRFSPYFIFLVFFNAVLALTSGGFRIVSDTLVIGCFSMVASSFSSSLLQFCLDSSHSLVNPSLSSSPLSSIIHHSFTFSLQTQNLPFQQILPTLTLLLYPLDCLHIMGLNRTYHIHQFIFSLFLVFFLLHFLFIPCGRLSWLFVSFLLNVKYTVSYRVVSYATLNYAAQTSSVFYSVFSKF